MTQLRGFFIYLFVAVSTGHAGIIHVPGDAQTIQIAISQAQPFDTISVAPGVYFEEIDYGGKSILIQSAEPLNSAIVESTIIVGSGFSSVVDFQNNTSSANPILDGFTIIGGAVGIDGFGGNSTVRNCVITNNVLWGLTEIGGVVQNCKITENGTGARNCGGMFEGCVFEGNAQAVFGGPFVANPTIVKCVIRNNGAGIVLQNPNMFVIKQSLITGNRQHGISGGKGSVENCLIAGNRGSGLSGTASMTVNSSTIVNNNGFGMVNTVGAIRNCIIWGNTLGEVSGASGGSAFSGTIEPMFIGIGYWDFLNDHWIDGDYRLTPQSPYIDAGDPLYLTVPNAPLEDITGSPRVVGARVDIGAFEFQADCVGEDFDSDGTADICDPDVDDDGIPNITDVCDETPPGLTVDFEGRPTSDLNHDCSVDLLDFALFQNDLVGP